MSIRRLPQYVVSQIAAGEVIERPAAVVKELVENAIDAGASDIHVRLEGGGQAAVIVDDDGRGMDRDELLLALERHATSKLPADDLVNINTLGFRGEALPAISSVSRLRIASRAAGVADAWLVEADMHGIRGPTPDSRPAGTRVEMRDLFYPLPARAKFLKQPRTELNHAADVVRRLAMAHPAVTFCLEHEGRDVLQLAAAKGSTLEGRSERLGAILGKEFAVNALSVLAERDGLVLEGLAAVPTFSKPSAASQYMFVNGRPVRDRLLLGAVRAAYRDLLARERHPVVALFLDLAPEDVDVNVHPAKAEVRFRDASRIRGLIVAALRHALVEAGHRVSNVVGAAALTSARPGILPRRLATLGPGQGSLSSAAALQASQTLVDGRSMQDFVAPSVQDNTNESLSANDAHPLGAARAQVHETYIIAETVNGIVVVDQHAAHERLVFERIKSGLNATGIARQLLLVPEVVELSGDGANALVQRAGELAEIGLLVESFGDAAVVVREVPAMLHHIDVRRLVCDLADDFMELDDAASLRDRLSEVCATLACHSSIRAGRILSPEEMNALLREMESTPHSGQCSHGRPTYVELRLADIERLFGRR